MTLLDALELLLRYAVAALCGELASHGYAAAKNDDFVTAATTIVSAVICGGLVVARAFYKSGRDYLLARLRRRHPAALLDAAAAVPGVAKIVATPALAGETSSPVVQSH